MPEGDTVFKLANYLQPALGGHELLAGSRIGKGGARLVGRRVGDVFAHGKHLFITLDDQLLLRSHLGMWGPGTAMPPVNHGRRRVRRRRSC